MKILHSEENNQGYCYQQGDDATAGNCDPSIEQSVTQGGDVSVCGNSGNIDEYQQGYIDGYNQTNPFAGISSQSSQSSK